MAEVLSQQAVLDLTELVQLVHLVLLERVVPALEEQGVEVGGTVEEVAIRGAAVVLAIPSPRE